MDIDFYYTTLRKNFGRQCLFSEEGPRIVEEFRSDKKLKSKYIAKNPVNKLVQVGCLKSNGQINTLIKDSVDRGMNHSEGGWPKEIDINDEEAVLRFRKKTERLDNYVCALKQLTVPMEHAILQNNAVNIYQKYFPKKGHCAQAELKTCRIQTVIRDLKIVTRPITHCSWSPEGDEFAVAHCNTDYQRLAPDQSNESYIWNAENTNTPLVVFEYDVPILTLEYNPKDVHWLVGGLYNGQVALFDVRKGRKPINTSTVESSHQDFAHSVLWTASKSGTEFFSASSDGVVKWWDCRRLDGPFEYVILDQTKGDIPKRHRAHMATCLEFEPSIPSKYSVGTEDGYMISGNRKGLTQQDRLPWMIKVHCGPVRSIQRHQIFTKNILTIGDWTAKIWSEDCRESPIYWTKNHRVELTCGEWSTERVSVFFLTREDGVLDLYDMLIEQKQAYVSMKLCDQPLTALRVRQDGVLVLAANSLGTTFLVRYSSDYAESTRSEKVCLSAMFERESRREKLLESRNREIKLRLREAAKESSVDFHKPPCEMEHNVKTYKAALEKQYREEVKVELERMIKLTEPDILSDDVNIADLCFGIDIVEEPKSPELEEKSP